ncbi:MAG: hypothetical protein ABSE62_04915 [Chthoniobacteraceae bacterium]|jgi:hypothetical protein
MPNPAQDDAGFELKARRDLRAAQLTSDERAVAEVILDYLVPGTSWAWLPSQVALRALCGAKPSKVALRARSGAKDMMDRSNVSVALRNLRIYGIIAVEPSKYPMFPYGCRYTFFLNNAATPWAVPPRSRGGRDLAERIDRWLRALNAGGGPEQGEFFNFTSELTAALAELNREEGFEPATPNARAGQSSSSGAQPPNRSAQSRADDKVEDTGVGLKPTLFLGEEAGSQPPGVGPEPTVTGPDTSSVGLKPTVPHEDINDWIDIDERDLSLRPIQSHQEHTESVGLKPTPAKLRPAHWPTWQEENRLMRELWEFFTSFIGAEETYLVMNGDGKTFKGYGKLWRWRIREFPFCVGMAVAKVEMNRKEVIKCVGGALNTEFVKAQRAYLRKQREKQEAQDRLENNQQPQDQNP